MSDYITDTGPLVSWINRRDQWHEWSVKTLTQLEPPLLTCEAVIAEAVWQLSSSSEAVDLLYGMVEAGALRIVELLPEHVAHIRAMSTKYPEMNFCDAAVVRLSEMYFQAKVITTDTEHFTIYRRLRDKPLPLIHPKG